MKRVLALRLSSMGDVLLTLPVLRGVLDSNPDLEILFVTRKRFAPYFADIDRLIVISFHPEGKHKGFLGLLRLYRETQAYQFSDVIDLHGILRTRVLDFLYFINRKPVYTVKKHRRLRKRLLRDHASPERVPHAVDRYLSVFKQAGITGVLCRQVFPVGVNPFEKQREGITARVGMAPL